MTRKRRMFDIELPEDESASIAAAASDRRGPMASAVRENADSLRAREETERSIRAENDALAHEFVRLQAQGLVLRRVPIDEIRTDKLSRDRRELEPDSLQELQESIRAIGLSNPIQVEETADGYQLVQGLRRLTAFRAIFAQTNDRTYAEIPSVVLAAGETIERLYRRMVDENLIRTDISFAEMAALARAFVEDPGTSAATLDEAVSLLFGSAGKQKRSYIKSFARMLGVLDRHLEHPEAIPRALGLAVRKRMDAEPDTVGALKRSLDPMISRSVEEELAVLRDYAGDIVGEDDQPFPAGNPTQKTHRSARKARTTFQLLCEHGAVKCTASPGRLEIKCESDFSAIERRRLETALRDFLDRIFDA